MEGVDRVRMRGRRAWTECAYVGRMPGRNVCVRGRNARTENVCADTIV